MNNRIIIKLLGEVIIIYISIFIFIYVCDSRVPTLFVTLADDHQQQDYYKAIGRGNNYIYKNMRN